VGSVKITPVPEGNKFKENCPNINYGSLMHNETWRYNMDCIEKMFARRSIRKYKNELITEIVLQNILEAGRLAPTATNSQPWHFVIARDQKAKEAFSFGGFNKFTGDAAFIVLGLYKPSEVIIEQLSLMDVTIALQSMVVAGWVQGVGSCWMGAFDERKLKDALNLPADSRVVGAVAFGIPDDNPSQPPKKSLSEIVHFDKW
jgi:nitroreductase